MTADCEICASIYPGKAHNRVTISSEGSLTFLVDADVVPAQEIIQLANSDPALPNIMLEIAVYEGQAGIETSASKHFDRWIGWLPPRMVPKRANTGGRRRAGANRRGGRQGRIALGVFLVYVATCLVEVCEIFRYIVRVAKGEKAP